MTIRSRDYRDPEDFGRVRDLLVRSYSPARRILSWGVDRWENARYANEALGGIAGVQRWSHSVRLWEDAAGVVAAAVTPEAPGEVFLQVHPDYLADAALLDEMLGFAEASRSAERPSDAEPWSVHVYADERPGALQAALAGRGYCDLGPAEALRWRPLDRPAADPVVPAGYEVRALDLDDEAAMAKYCALEYATFGRTRWTPEMVRVVRRTPSYRPDLDLVVVAPDGSHAAFATVWLNPDNSLGCFEPVGTHPDHRRRGLALALLNEGIRRLQALGVTMAYVGAGYGSPANRLYEAAGFREHDVVHRWEKRLDASPFVP